MSSKNQGEGNQEAAQEYNEKTQNFVDAGCVEKNKNRHVNLPEEEKKEIQQAEEIGKAKAKK